MSIWNTFETKIDRMETSYVKKEALLDVDWNNREVVDVASVNEDKAVPVELSRILTPVYGTSKWWKTMLNNGEQDIVKESLSKFWTLTTSPIIAADLIYFKENINAPVLLTNDIFYTEGGGDKKDEVPSYFNKIVTEVNNSFEYNKVVLGLDKITNNIEIQFLDMTKRAELKVGDFVDPGLFITLISKKISIAPGINRLVCTNGVTSHFNFWENTYNFEDSGDFISRAANLANWLRETIDKPVKSLSELSVLTQGLSKEMVKSLWKEWSLKLEDKNLDWFCIINDITEYAKRVINLSRVRMIEFGEVVREYFTDASEKLCPVCKHKTIIDVEEVPIKKEFEGALA